MTNAATKPALEVLLVDDDADLRADMASYFSHQGHGVEQCASGEEALELMERRDVDVVVLDLLMPGMTWFGCAQGTASAAMRSARWSC